MRESRDKDQHVQCLSCFAVSPPWSICSRSYDKIPETLTTDQIIRIGGARVGNQSDLC